MEGGSGFPQFINLFSVLLIFSLASSNLSPEFLIICCLTVGKISQNANFVEGTLEKGVFGRGKTLTSFVRSESRLWSQTLGLGYSFFKGYSIRYQAFVQIRKNNSSGQMQPQWIHRLVKYYIFYNQHIQDSQRSLAWSALSDHYCTADHHTAFSFVLKTEIIIPYS